MLIAVACLTLVALAVILFAYSQQRAHREAQAQWVLERRELLERIQRPELRPVVAAAEPLEIPERAPDEWAKVGQIGHISDDYGLGDD